jgi:hypothetical protein
MMLLPSSMVMIHQQPVSGPLKKSDMHRTGIKAQERRHLAVSYRPLKPRKTEYIFPDQAEAKTNDAIT